MMSIKSEYPWVKGPKWGQPKGVVAVLDIDGHHFEVEKRPYVLPAHHVRAYFDSATNTSRYQLVVDGVKRGSESPKLYAVVAAADAMVSWGRASAEVQP